MYLGINLKNFLYLKLDENKINKKILGEQTGINHNVIYKLFSGRYLNPRLKLLLKLARYFNCSIDELIGRESKYHISVENYKNTKEEEISDNLKNFIKEKMQKTNLTAAQLARKVGCTEKLLPSILDSKIKHETLGASSALILANYFDIPLEQMISKARYS